MMPLSATSIAAVPGPCSPGITQAIDRLYPDSGAARYGISPEQFVQWVAAVVTKYAADAGESEQLLLLEKLRIDELILARACSAGNDAAWETFLLRFRASLYECAYRIAGNDATGREIADELYADLYGIANREGHRISKLDYYMGRGSLEGWLRSVLSQRYIDRCRSYSKNVSLDEQVESGTSFPAATENTGSGADPRLAAALDATLDELPPEDRFLLASYYLDRCTLAQLARTLRVHESTMSRRLDRILTHLRKQVVRRLRASGLNARQCEELFQELDVRDLDVQVAAKLRQETSAAAFYNKDGSAT